MRVMAVSRHVGKLARSSDSGARRFDMYVRQLPNPRFDPAAELHVEPSSLGEEAEQVAAGVDVDGVGFQAARGRV